VNNLAKMSESTLPELWKPIKIYSNQASITAWEESLGNKILWGIEL
jgi:hypothetical protein